MAYVANEAKNIKPEEVAAGLAAAVVAAGLASLDQKSRVRLLRWRRLEQLRQAQRRFREAHGNMYQYRPVEVVA